MKSKKQSLLLFALRLLSLLLMNPDVNSQVPVDRDQQWEIFKKMKQVWDTSSVCQMIGDWKWDKSQKAKMVPGEFELEIPYKVGTIEDKIENTGICRYLVTLFDDNIFRYYPAIKRMRFIIQPKGSTLKTVFVYSLLNGDCISETCDNEKPTTFCYDTKNPFRNL